MTIGYTSTGTKLKDRIYRSYLKYMYHMLLRISIIVRQSGKHKAALEFEITPIQNPTNSTTP